MNTSPASYATIGIISDTHGLLRPQALKALEGVDHIIHAGDIGKLGVLYELMLVAPVAAVRGNVDRGAWAEEIPETLSLELEGQQIFVLHNLQELRIDPAAEGYSCVVFGHSHMPAVYESKGVLYINPGSAGPRRFKLPVCVALLNIQNGKTETRLIELAI